MKQRVQHPKVNERKVEGRSYWFFRYWSDEIQPDGSVKTTRKFHKIGPSKGDKALKRKDAEAKRDEFLAGLGKEAEKAQAATAEEPMPTEPGEIIFGRLAALWQSDYVEKVVGGRPLVKKSTQDTYKRLLKHILPRWKDARLKELRPKEVRDWLEAVCTSWTRMANLRNLMSGIITKAIEWEIIPATFANPMKRVKLPKRWNVHELRILSEEETERVLARVPEPYRLIHETNLDTGTRISESTALMLKHVDLERGTISIEQRAYNGEVDDPKTPNSRRVLALGTLAKRYKAWIAKLERKGPNDYVFPDPDDNSIPCPYHRARYALKKAAKDENVNFVGFGPHSLRRANITWRQEVGGTAIEASKIAGHSKVDMTARYSYVQLKRQTELTRKVQAKRKNAARRARKQNVFEISKAKNAKAKAKGKKGAAA